MWTHARRSDVAAVERTLQLLVASGVTPDERHEKARAWASGETPRRLDVLWPGGRTSNNCVSHIPVSPPGLERPR